MAILNVLDKPVDKLPIIFQDEFFYYVDSFSVLVSPFMISLPLKLEYFRCATHARGFIDYKQFLVFLSESKASEPRTRARDNYLLRGDATHGEKGRVSSREAIFTHAPRVVCSVYYR